MALVGLHEAPALAAVARALSIGDLVKKSTSALVLTAVARQATWQVIGGSRRIVTQTRARVEELVTGADPSASEVIVNTLGGRVGTIGQIVEGEAELAIGETSLTFLTALGPLAYSVTAMAQGHYPIVNDASGRILATNRELPALVQKTGSAVERLAGRKLSEGLALVRAEQR
ncbi:MAG TPA: hypothetical protein VMI54_24985 [Polyangiaceae bacterium]|nr:hypothetical protein [Polyangiaceae bacterium]